MATFSVGSIPFWVTPTAVMQCFLGLADWGVRGTPEEIADFQRLYDRLIPLLVSLPHDESVDRFCIDAIGTIAALVDELQPRSRLARNFAQMIKNSLWSKPNRDTATWYALTYQHVIGDWLASPLGELAIHATAVLAAWDVLPLSYGLAASSSFGNLILGKYVPKTRAVCVQLDAICEQPYPALNFLETLLHECIHAVIHEHMGDDAERRELNWLNELAAVCTSHFAIVAAARQLGQPAHYRAIEQQLETLRDTNRYGALVRDVMSEVGDLTMPWRAWQAIFALDPERRRSYAAEAVIVPVLREAGWRVTFPYTFDDGSKYVTCFSHMAGETP